MLNNISLQKEKSRIPQNALSNLDWSVLILFLADLWIFSYQQILSLLNQFLPPKLVIGTFFPSLASVLCPEPFEIPIYLLLTLLFILFIYGITQIKNSIASITLAIQTPFKYLALLIATLIFVYYLGPYPFPEIRALSFTHPRTIPIGFILTLAVATYILSKKIQLNNKKHLILLYSIIAIIIGIVFFEPGFPLSYLDTAFILGPIYEMANDKTVITEIPSQYGFLSTILLGLFAKWIGFPFNLLPIWIWLATILEYCFYFYLFLNINKKLPLAIIGILAAIIFRVYSSPWPILVYTQGTVIRWLPFIIAYFFYFKIKDLNNKKYLLLIAFASLLSLDSGIQMLMSYMFTLFCILIKQRQTFKTCIKNTLILSFFIIAIYLVIVTVLSILGYQWVNPRDLFTTIIQFSRQGFMMVPMPSQTFFWLIPLLYLSVVAAFFRQKTVAFEDKFILYSANIILCQSLYYIGRSFYLNLMHLGAFFFVTLFLFIGRYWKVLENSHKRQKAYALLFLVFIAIPAWNLRERIEPALHTDFMVVKSGTVMNLDNGIQRTYSNEEIQLIQSIPDEKVAVFAPDDTYLLKMANKASLINANPQYAIFTTSDLDRAINGIQDHCPTEIITDRNAYYTPAQPRTLANVFDDQTLLLHRLEQYCHTTYKVLACSQRICLAISPSASPALIEKQKALIANFWNDYE